MGPSTLAGRISSETLPGWTPAPGYRLSGTGRDTLRNPCFVVGEERLFYLRFLIYGLENVTLEPHEKLYLTNGNEIILLSKTV